MLQWIMHLLTHGLRALSSIFVVLLFLSPLLPATIHADVSNVTHYVSQDPSISGFNDLYAPWQVTYEFDEDGPSTLCGGAANYVYDVAQWNTGSTTPGNLIYSGTNVAGHVIEGYTSLAMWQRPLGMGTSGETRRFYTVAPIAPGSDPSTQSCDSKSLAGNLNAVEIPPEPVATSSPPEFEPGNVLALFTLWFGAAGLAFFLVREFAL